MIMIRTQLVHDRLRSLTGKALVGSSARDRGSILAQSFCRISLLFDISFGIHCGAATNSGDSAAWSKGRISVLPSSAANGRGSNPRAVFPLSLPFAACIVRASSLATNRGKVVVPKFRDRLWLSFCGKHVCSGLYMTVC